MRIAVIVSLALALVVVGCGARTDVLPEGAPADGSIAPTPTPDPTTTPTPTTVEPTPTCHPTFPGEGASCVGSTRCSWRDACGHLITAQCNGGGWRADVATPRCDTTCPPSEPPRGAPCTLDPTQRCPFTNACGATETVRCILNAYVVERAPCPCPSERPKFGEACGEEGQHCSWTNACGASDVGTCTSGKWTIDLKSCGPCPVFPPLSGNPCTGSSACSYTAFDSRGHECIEKCLCAADGRWSCDAPRC